MNIYRLCKDPKRTVTLYLHPILNTDMEFTTSCAKIRQLLVIILFVDIVDHLVFL